MREARIECLAVKYRLPKLGFSLKKGDVEFVPEETARNSKELKSARLAGAVSVRYIERCKVAKNPDPIKHIPPSVRMSRPNMGGMLMKPPLPPSPQDPPEEKVQSVSADEVRRIIREEMRAALAETPSQTVVNNVVDTEAIVAAFASTPGFMVPQTTGTVDPDVPVYIPTDIVNKDAKTDIQTEKASSEADGVDAAAAALKKAKPKKRTPRKKATPKE